MLLGAFHTLEVMEEKSFGMLWGDGSVVLLRRHVPKDCSVGDQLRVFVYENAEGKTVAVAKTPKGGVGDFACLKVVDRSKHGVFMDWGIEKDLFVPRSEQSSDMRVDQFYVVAITNDEQGRVMGSSLIREFLDDDMSELKAGRNVKVMAYERHERGMKVIVDNRWDGLIYKDEIYQPMRIGTRAEGTVAKVRDDAKLDIHIRSHGMAGMDAGREQLLEKLRANELFLPVHDKSPPEVIKERLSMSKKAFKRALGNLLRERLVRVQGEGIILVDADDVKPDIQGT